MLIKEENETSIEYYEIEKDSSKSLLFLLAPFSFTINQFPSRCSVHFLAKLQ